MSEVCRDYRLKVEKLFEKAAEYVREAFGRRIKQGTVREAISRYERKGKIPDWVKDFIRSLQQKPVHA